MNPTPSDVHVNSLLTNISVAYLQDTNNFIATKVFPVVPVDKQSNLYPIWDRTDFNRDEMEKRGPATESKGGGFRLSTSSYFADVWAFHKDLDKQTLRNSDFGNLEIETTEYLTRKALIRKEKLFVTSFMGTGIWATDVTGVAAGPTTGQVLQWNDGDSDPITDIDNALYTGLSTTGMELNTLVVGYRVFQRLKNHPLIIDRVKYTQTIGANGTVKISEAALAGLFGVKNFYVMKAIENTAKEGATESNAFIGGTKALLTYVPERPGKNTPSGGYTFSWAGDEGDFVDGVGVSNFYMPHIKATRYEVEMAFDMKLIGSDLGVFFTSIVA